MTPAKIKRSVGKEPFLYPLPVLLVATYDQSGKANVMNAAWGGICSSDPVSLSVAIRPSRHTHDALLARKAFTVGIASQQMVKEADYVGMVSGSREDKFANAGFTEVKAEKVDAPYVAECPVVLECSLTGSLDLGAHTLMIGAIEDVKIDEDCLDAGKPMLEKIAPLVFDAGGGHYYAVGAKVAQAFYVGRELIKK